MNTTTRLQEEILERYRKEKPIYEQLGKYVVNYVKQAVENLGEDSSLFFEIEPRYRTKEEGVLIEKALYREKRYANPYEDITDKVGVRFVVLFTDRMDIINDIVTTIPDMEYSKDRDFKEEQKKSPLVFSYLSDHFVVHPKEAIEIEGIRIPETFCCEVQVRSLMQHAYAQITHDIFYKPSVINDNPEMERQVARCMAILEMADEKFNIFIRYNKEMEKEMPSMLRCLQTQYSEKLGHEVKVDLRFDKTMLLDLDEDSTVSVESIIDFYNSPKGEKAIRTLSGFLHRNSLLLYKHVSVMFVVYLLMKGPKEKRQLIRNWGFNRQLLEDIFADFGVSLEGFQRR